MHQIILLVDQLFPSRIDINLFYKDSGNKIFYLLASLRTGSIVLSIAKSISSFVIASIGGEILMYDFPVSGL